MIRLFSTMRHGPIGLDLGTRSVKLVQFSADQGRLVDAARWELEMADGAGSNGQRNRELVDAIRQARTGRNFRGRDVVLCLTNRQLQVQNIRVPKINPEGMDALVQQEVAGRLPFPASEAEIRYIEAADIRQGDLLMREVIALACHQPVLEETLEVAEAAGLRPVAVDVEPLALARAYVRQFRRDEDRQQRTMFVHVGYASTAVLIAQGDHVFFFKYADLGGRHMDEAVARHLKMKIHEARALRRHNGDRRADQQDPVVARSVAEAVRPVVERLVGELAKCMRYHSVTFRGQPLVRLLLGGGEATPALMETLTQRLNLKCELSDPLRGYLTTIEIGRKGVWDVAAGLAMRN